MPIVFYTGVVATATAAMTNRLAEETSPYLRQHADNPVDWHPWGETALDQARAEDKPILLSVGYSACHWCHVMAHESFEDASVAALMNAYFVNIKVDREERPDLDKVYQLAFQIMNQRPGGWPLTVILDPHTQAPFMAGTYFPKTAAHGMPAFPDVLRQVADWYAHNKHRLEDQKQRLDDIFARLEPQPVAAIDGDAPLRQARRQLEANFDAEHGGFTGAPKFPHPTSLELLFTLAGHGDERAGDMARFSLRCLCAGGLFDHIGGGFYRYAVDAHWAIPHFEKMLYDNGPLLALTSEQAAATGDALLTQAAHATADWALRAMQSPEGGFYASLDADSEGGEGAFYVWDRDQVQRLLGDDYPAFAAAYGLEAEPNFEGHWHLQLGAGTQPDAGTITGLEPARRCLFQQRAQRPAPGRDDKVLTAWNALMVGGLAAAHRHLGRTDCLEAARETLAFIRVRLWREDRLLASYKDGEAKLPAYLDDYAFLLEALLEMLQERWDGAHLAWAQALADALLEHFEDAEAGGFFFTAHDHEALLHRPKPLADESTPAGNGVAARALLRLGWLLGEPRYLAAGERTLRYAANALRQHPIAHTSLVTALHEYRQPPEIVILRGSEQILPAWRQAAAAPQRLIFSIPENADDLPIALAEKRPQGEAVAYLCRGMTCSPPITRIEDLRQEKNE